MGSLNFINDPELFELYDVAIADATHTSENMKAVIDYVFENAYIYPVAYGITARVYAKDKLTSLYYREGYVTLTASTYAGQEENVDPEHEILSLGGETDLSAVAGSYTFSEVVGEGSGSCEYTLTLNEDGTYRIDQLNMYGEEVYIEGSFTMAGETVVCAAPEAGVQGAMDRFLNSGWCDVDAPESSWTLNGDGTATPVGYVESEPQDDGGETEAVFSGLKTPSVEIPDDYHMFIFFEEYEGDYSQWQLYVNDTSYILAVMLPNGMEFIYTGEKTQDGPTIVMGAPNEADNPKLGDFWAEDGTITWQILGQSDCVPVDFSGFQAYSDAVAAGEMGYDFFAAQA